MFYIVGKIIFDQGNHVNVGELMLQHGGGNAAAGTCQGANATADAMKRELICQLLALADAG